MSSLYRYVLTPKVRCWQRSTRAWYTYTKNTQTSKLHKDRETKAPLSSVIFEAMVWPRLLWSVTLTWGLSSVVPPGVCIGAAPHSPCVCFQCIAKDVTKVHARVLEKFLQVQSYRCPFKVKSEKTLDEGGGVLRSNSRVKKKTKGNVNERRAGGWRVGWAGAALAEDNG